MGCAKDIVEHVRRAALPVQRLSARQRGREAARPGVAGRDAGTGAARCWRRRRRPRTTVQSPLRWSEDALWKLDYLNIEQIGEEEMQRRREEFIRQKAIAKGLREQAA